MKSLRLDHVTIDTADVEASIAFYRAFFDLRPGWRPDWDIGGAWLYAQDGDYPILHLLERPHVEGQGMFDHIAFRCEGLAGYLEKVKAAGGWFEARPVEGTPYTQVHHYDPNGVKIEAIFEEPLGAPRIASDDPGGALSGQDVPRR